MTEAQLLKRLKRFVGLHDSQAEAARQIGVTPPFLNMVLKRKKRPGRKVLAALGLSVKKDYVKP